MTDRLLRDPMTPRRVTRSCALCLALVLSGAWPPPTHATGSVSDPAVERYPVRLTIERDGKVTQAGTGFYVHEGHDLFLVTANHILYKKGRNTRWGETAEVVSSDASHHLTLDLNELHTAGNIRSHALYDSVILRVGALEDGRVQYLTGVRDRSVHPTPPPSLPTRLLTTFEQVEIGSTFILSGYPSGLDHPRDTPPALLSRRVELMETFHEEALLLLKLIAYPGDSGAPIFHRVEKDGITELRVVGLLTHVYTKIQGLPRHLKHLVLPYWFGCAIPLDAILESVTSVARGHTTDGLARGDATRRECPKPDARYHGSTLSFMFKNKTFVVPFESGESHGQHPPSGGAGKP